MELHPVDKSSTTSSIANHGAPSDTIHNNNVIAGGLNDIAVGETSDTSKNIPVTTKSNETYEDVIAELGKLGRYQLLLFSMMLSMVFTVGCHFKFMIYGGIFPKEMVCPEQNSSISMDADQLAYKPEFAAHGILLVISDTGNNTCYDTGNMAYHSIAADWELVGSRSYLVSTVISVQMTGVFIGPLVAGMIADRFGRKPTIFVMSACMLISGLATGFCRSWQMFAFVRFWVGLCAGSALTTGFVYTTENFLGSWRVALNNIPWPLNYFFFTLTAWLTKDWVWHSWVVNIPVFFTLMFLLFLSESPKWLLARGRKVEAKQIILRIGRMNGVSEEHLKEIMSTNPVLSTKAENSFMSKNVIGNEERSAEIHAVTNYDETNEQRVKNEHNNILANCSASADNKL